MNTAVTTATQNKPTLKSMLDNESVKNRFTEVLGAKAPGFISSIISATSTNKMLQECEPSSIIGAAAIAATLDLPINSSLGFAHIVPYNSPDGKKAQFQMGWKGYVQLAMRTGQYKTINVTEVLSSQLKSVDNLTGEYVFDWTKNDGEVVGYAAYFKTVNGFEKTVYWSVAKIQAHGKKYSKSYANQYGQWQLNFPSMAMKTLVKHLLSTWGILSIDIQKAVSVDQGVAKNETGEVITFEDSTATVVNEENPQLSNSEPSTPASTLPEDKL